MTTPYVLTRTVTRQECSWLKEDLQIGQQVWPYSGHDYGCISSKGKACTKELNKTPFFEVPKDALREAMWHEID